YVDTLYFFYTYPWCFLFLSFSLVPLLVGDFLLVVLFYFFFYFFIIILLLSAFGCGPDFYFVL
ncbi:hypothetical protein PPACK8108_LOCUS25690, partial [Phakopsora pachyrhizi]